MSLEQQIDYLKTFVNANGNEGDFDYVAAFTMFRAIVENLARHHLAADIESLHETGFQLNRDETIFLKKVVSQLGSEA